MSQTTKHRGGNRAVKSKSVQHAKTVLAAILLLFVAVMLVLWIISLIP